MLKSQKDFMIFSKNQDPPPNKFLLIQLSQWLEESWEFNAGFNDKWSNLVELGNKEERTKLRDSTIDSKNKLINFWFKFEWWRKKKTWTKL